MKFHWRTLIFQFVLPFAASQAIASQMAKTIGDPTEVHQYPKASSAVVKVLPKGTEVKISLHPTLDQYENGWYKTILPGEGYGYIEGNFLQTYPLRDEMMHVGISPSEIEPALVWDTSARGHLRGMLLGGLNLNTYGLEFGGEGEFTYSVHLSNETKYLNRVWAMGLAYVFFSERSPFIGASIVLTPYTRSRTEFEFRMRIGRSVAAPPLEGSLHFTLNYPFTLTHQTHLSGYLETAILGTVGTSVFYAWAATGVGIHF